MDNLKKRVEDEHNECDGVIRTIRVFDEVDGVNTQVEQYYQCMGCGSFIR